MRVPVDLVAVLCSVLKPIPVSIPTVKLAVDTLVHVLRNSLLCVAVGWLFGYCFTVGNLFTGLPPGQQSYPAFSAANIAWFYGVFSGCMIVLMATKLLSEQFVGCSDRQIAGSNQSSRRLNIFQCVMKLLKRMVLHLVWTSIVVVGGDFAIYSTVPVSWRQYKPCVYIAAFWGFYIMVMADIFVRNIYETETVRGLLAKGNQQHQRWMWMPSPRRFLRVYTRNLPVMVFVLIAIVYVHVISHFVSFRGQWELFGFASASIALKLTLQELAKHLLTISQRSLSRQTMIVLVSTPTIIVDTQVRMLLLRQASVSSSVVGTILLAIFEILVRGVKSLVVQRQTRGPAFTWNMSRRSTVDRAPRTSMSKPQPKQMQVVPAATTTSLKTTRSGSAIQSRIYSKGETAEQFNARHAAEELRRKRRVLHVAEIYADMYAEYIAIGCSYAILFFYQNHPQFRFKLTVYGNSGDTVGSREDHLLSVGAFQLGVEVIVDLLACVIEAAEGVEFKSFDQNDPFLVFFLAILSFSNVAISSGLYMH